MEEGYADILLIPALSSALVMAGAKLAKAPFYMPTSFNREQYPAWYEDNHIEALEAGKMMESLGLTSGHSCQLPLPLKLKRKIVAIMAYPLVQCVFCP